MMRKFVLAIVICFVSGQVLAQTAPAAKPGPGGIWIVLPGPAGAGNTYEISRTGVSNADNSAAVLPPASRAEMDARIADINRDEYNLGEMPKSSQLDVLWRLLQRNAPRDSFAPVLNSLPALYACGMAWFDADVAKNTAVKYKVVKKSSASAALQEWTTEAVKWPGTGPKMNFTIEKVQSMKGGNTFDLLAEFPKELSHFRVFRSYHLRSGFEPVSARVLIRKEGKLLHLHVFDETATEKVLYSYYVVPFDAAGNPGTYSPEVLMYSVPDNTIQPSVRRLRTESDTARGGIKLMWSLPQKSNIVSINIYRGFRYDGKYGKIASVAPTDSVYLDFDVEPVKTYYYTVVLNGTFETSPTSPRTSGMLEASWDNMLPPQDFTAEANGQIVKLSWTKLEKDTRAYNIYRSVVGTNNWLRIKQIVSSDSAMVVYDTLPKSKENLRYAYSITDVNTSYKEGPPSNVEAVGVAGTETLPAPESLSAIVHSDGKVMLIWSNTARISAYVNGYNIYKAELTEEGEVVGGWTKLNATQIGSDVNIYYDQPAGNRWFAYVVRSAGFDGAEGKNSPESRVIIRTDARLNVSQAAVYTSTEGVRIDWTEPLDKELKAVEIWKAEKGTEAVLLHSALPGKGTFTDKEVKPGKVYLFTVRCVYTDGSTSAFMEAGVSRP